MTIHAEYGATALSWRLKNPRPKILQVITSNPGKNEEEIFVIVTELAKSDDNLLEGLVQYAVINAIRSRRGYDESKESKLDAKEIARSVIVCMLLPSGKSLLESDGKDCIQAGGWFTSIGKKVGNSNRVKDIFSIDDLVSLWKERK